jgi:hypothetical protein
MLREATISHQNAPPTPSIAGVELTGPLRRLGPERDTIALICASRARPAGHGPPEPTPSRGDGAFLAGFPAAAVDALVAVSGSDAQTPSDSIEVRHLGGARGRPAPAAAAAVLPARLPPPPAEDQSRPRPRPGDHLRPPSLADPGPDLTRPGGWPPSAEVRVQARVARTARSDWPGRVVTATRPDSR